MKKANGSTGAGAISKLRLTRTTLRLLTVHTGIRAGGSAKTCDSWDCDSGEGPGGGKQPPPKLQ